MSTEKIVFEPPSRFSALSIWPHQKKYYAQKGIDAWAHDVPSYVTSNPYIARQYAKTTAYFILNWIQKNPDAMHHPFYMIELGTGTGQFSFYFLSSLIAFLQDLQCDHIKICYVMTDVTESLFTFWRKHPALQSFMEAGILDFALCDFNAVDCFQLQLKQKTVSSSDFKNPPVVIANYIFDSLPTDLFYAHNGKLEQVLVSLKTHQKNVKAGSFINLNGLDFEYHPESISDVYYENKFDSILTEYKNTLIDSYFQFPICLLQNIQKLLTLTNNRLVLLSSDKGHSSFEELDHCDTPELAIHGNCFSTMVNYEALSRYLKNQGGDYCVQQFRDHIITCVFTSGFEMESYPLFKNQAREMVNTFSPTDYFDLFKNIERNFQHATLEELLAFLNLSCWDARLFSKLCDHIVEQVDQAHPDTRLFLQKNLPLIADSFYFYPNCDDVYFNVAIVYQALNAFEAAIGYYQKSIAVFEGSDVVLFNIAMCHYSMHQKNEALVYLKRALQLNQNLSHIKEMIALIEKK
jgi:tetratricopeptide (TPR) repeat protein